MKFSKNMIWGPVAAVSAVIAVPAQAQDSADAGSAFELSANAGVVSDYRFRGISLSDKDPAIQGGIDLGHESGFFIGTWASSIEDYAGANVEVDLYGGYGTTVGAVDLSVTALYYAYPGGSGVDYFELMGSVSTGVGPATVGMDVAWVPSQDNFGGDNFYVAGNLEVPFGESGAAFFGHVGLEDGDVYDSKWDWEAGLSYSINDNLSATVSYVDTNYKGVDEAGRLAKAGVVATLIASF